MNNILSIEEIILQATPYDGWLYLPDEKLSLDTKGIFIQSDKDADPESHDHIPDVVKNNKWVVTIDSDTVEDIIFNAKAQIPDIKLSDLFRAFVYYIENDAFIVF